MSHKNEASEEASTTVAVDEEDPNVSGCEAATDHLPPPMDTTADLVEDDTWLGCEEVTGLSPTEEEVNWSGLEDVTASLPPTEEPVASVEGGVGCEDLNLPPVEHSASALEDVSTARVVSASFPPAEESAPSLDEDLSRIDDEDLDLPPVQNPAAVVKDVDGISCEDLDIPPVDHVTAPVEEDINATDCDDLNPPPASDTSAFTADASQLPKIDPEEEEEEEDQFSDFQTSSSPLPVRKYYYCCHS